MWEDPNQLALSAQLTLDPDATLLLTLVLMPIVTEVLFRGLIFGSVSHKKPGRRIRRFHFAFRRAERMAAYFYQRGLGVSDPSGQILGARRRFGLVLRKKRKRLGSDRPAFRDQRRGCFSDKSVTGVLWQGFGS
jgi:hypothetical protein